MTDREPLNLYPHDWTRLSEVMHYADQRKITLQQAIEELVNTGLSHVNRDECRSVY